MKPFLRESSYCQTIKAAVLTVLVLFPLRLSAADGVVVFRKSGKAFDDVVKGVRDELREDFIVVEKILDKTATLDTVATVMDEWRPKCVVLMDNTIIRVYRDYQATLDSSTQSVPTVSLMAVMVSDAISGLENASGIEYEIPIVTGIINLRSVLGRPVRRVGVVYRGILGEFIRANRVLCDREGIELVTVSLPNRSGRFRIDVREALRKLFERRIEALWVPNDNVLLRADIIRGTWMPALRNSKIPVVVGVEVLVEPRLNFGTFAVIPDHVALGAQAAEMVFDIRDNGWKCENGRVYPPLAIIKVINLPHMRRKFNVSEKKLEEIDKKLR